LNAGRTLHHPAPSTKAGLALELASLLAARAEKIGQPYLRSWVLTDTRAQQYKHDFDALALLAPLDCRFSGYEEFIRRLVSSLRKP
jgi:hypothetical protein